MENFTPISPYALPDNLFTRIGRDWMLVTAAKPDGSVNTMTASWGMAGILWNKPVAVAFVRPQRYTDEFIPTTDRYTLSFFTEAQRNALKLCGTKSGRDCDKIAEAGLTPITLPSGGVAFSEATLILDCRRLYTGKLEKDGFLDASLLGHYPIDDFHNVYVAEITEAYTR